MTCPLCRNGTLSVTQINETYKSLYTDGGISVKFLPNTSPPIIACSSRNVVQCSNHCIINEKLYTIIPVTHLGDAVLKWKPLTEDRKIILKQLLMTDYSYVFQNEQEVFQILAPLGMDVKDNTYKITIITPLNTIIKVYKTSTGYTWGSIVAALCLFYTGTLCLPTIPERKQTMVDSITVMEDMELKLLAQTATTLLESFLKG